VIDVGAIPMEELELVWCRCIDCRYMLPPRKGTTGVGCSRHPVDGDRDVTAWHRCADYAARSDRGGQQEGEAT